MATWPFQKIRSPRLERRRIGGRRRSQRRFLHVAVARACDAAGGQRDLDEPRAIETERGLAAPQIGRAEKALGDRDEVRFVLVERRKVRGRHVGAGWRHRHAILDARDGEARAERQRFERRQFDRRTGKHKRAQRRHLVRRRRAGRRQRVFRQPADITVGGELTPGPALAVRIVDRDALALERFGFERRVRPRLAAQRRLRLDDFADAAFDDNAPPSPCLRDASPPDRRGPA